MGKLVNEVGNRYGRLIVVERAGSTEANKAIWRCQCDCGNTTTVIGSKLRDGEVKSCGCLHSETAAENGRKSRKSIATHNGAHERLYYVWRSMRNRCMNPKHSRYNDWGGRGITVCEAWAKDYATFRAWAIANGYDQNAQRGKCTIERIDNNKGYCPENCRWATAKEQAQNRRPRSNHDRGDFILVEVREGFNMDDLISRSALLGKAANVTKYDEGGWGMDLKAVSVEDVLKAPAVDAGPNWISVEDKLPEKSGDYLAFTEKGIFMVLSYSEIHRAFNAYDWCENITPIRCTHWMPLPEVKEHD